MANPNPAAFLADSISTFQKSALKLLKDLEKQLAQADTDTRDARTERDNAIKQTRVSHTELEAQKQDIVRYKASLIQAERTIEDQASIISRLHREVNHWKEQARNWQDHFTRVEEERCSLATRFDKMIAAQHRAFGPTIPTHLFSDIATSISAPPIKQSSTAALLPSSKKNTSSKCKPPLDSPATVPESPAPVRRPKVVNSRSRTKAEQVIKSASDSHGGPVGNNDDPPRDPPLSRLVRRVQAVIRVKSEEDEDLEFQTSPSDTDSPIDGNSRPPRRKRGVSNRKNKQTQQNGEDEWPNPDAPQSAPLYHKGLESDGDDELMLGGEDSRQTDPPIKRRKLNRSTRQKPPKRA